MPSSFAAAVRLLRASSSLRRRARVGRVPDRGHAHRARGRRARAGRASPCASTSVPAFTSSSAAPTMSDGPPAARAAGAITNTTAAATAARGNLMRPDDSLSVGGRAALEEQLKRLPAKPGVYLFRDDGGRVLYIGKAKSLRPRVRSYFQRGGDSRAADRAAAGPRRGHRGDRHRHRGRGAPRRAEPGQAPPAAVQHPAARRQVVPVHRGHGRGRVPARDVHARAAPARRRLLRAVREREEGARDARRPQPRLPVPAVRGAEAGPPLGHPVPRLPHRALQGAVRRLRLARRTTARSSTA